MNNLDSQNNSSNVRYQKKPVTDRMLLVGIDESNLQIFEEKIFVQKYKETYQQLQEAESKLSAITRELFELTKSQGKQSEEKIKVLKTEKYNANNKANKYNQLLRNLEEGEIFISLVSKERQKRQVSLSKMVYGVTDNKKSPQKSNAINKDTLLYCHKCGAECSKGSVFCNKCGAKIMREDVENKGDKSTKNIFVRIYDCIENIADTLGDIPVIGCFLTIIFSLLCVGIVGFAGIMILIGLFSIHYILGLIVLLVGVNIITYFASFEWGARKPWFFWASLVLSIFALLAPLFMG